MKDGLEPVLESPESSAPANSRKCPESSHPAENAEIPEPKDEFPEYSDIAKESRQSSDPSDPANNREFPDSHGCEPAREPTRTSRPGSSNESEASTVSRRTVPFISEIDCDFA